MYLSSMPVLMLSRGLFFGAYLLLAGEALVKDLLIRLCGLASHPGYLRCQGMVDRIGLKVEILL